MNNSLKNLNRAKNVEIIIKTIIRHFSLKTINPNK